jgi:hypothetical protein
MKVVVAVGLLVLGGLAAYGSDAGARAGADAGAGAYRVAAPAAEKAPAAAQVTVADSPLVREVRRWRQARQVSQPVALPECTGTGSPHFETPEAAMRYLARAWNSDDLDALCHVTNPNARIRLLNMHREAVNLRLDRCRPSLPGAYSCTFEHDFPGRMHRDGVGHAWVDVAAARGPGWYMTVFLGCGG